MRLLFFISAFFFSSVLLAQNMGVRVGLTTATPTGNNDTFDFDFLESFSPGYQAGVFGNFKLSDVIILKPEFSYREYTIKQEVTWYSNDYNIDQKHTTFSGDLNCISDSISSSSSGTLLRSSKTSEVIFTPS